MFHLPAIVQADLDAHNNAARSVQHLQYGAVNGVFRCRTPVVRLWPSAVPFPKSDLVSAQALMQEMNQRYRSASPGERKVLLSAWAQSEALALGDRFGGAVRAALGVGLAVRKVKGVETVYGWLRMQNTREQYGYIVDGKVDTGDEVYWAKPESQYFEYAGKVYSVAVLVLGKKVAKKIKK